MTTPAVRVERRVGQRFAFLLPVSLRDAASALEGLGFTQDVSSRGVFFFTDVPIHENAEIELTLQMPAEITLGESMRVRCRGRVLRVLKPAGHIGAPEPNSPRSVAPAETKIGVAVRFERYEYLPASAEGSAAFRRLSSLHSQHDDDRPLPVRTGPALG
jgi:hypothetical protein